MADKHDRTFIARAKRMKNCAQFMAPQRIKDHRTKHEATDVQKVMDGDIGGFIEAWLRAGPEGRRK